MSFGTRLRQLRTAAFATTTEIGLIAGVDARMIVNIENGVVRETQAIWDALTAHYPPLRTGNPRPTDPTPSSTPVINPHVIVYKRRMQPLQDARRGLNVGITNMTRIRDLVLLCMRGDYTIDEILQELA